MIADLPRTNGRCRAIVAGFAGKRVLVVGDVMLDEYVWGRVTRVSPEAPVPVVEVERRSYLAGGAANVARNLASLGARVSLVGLVGADAEAARLGEVLAAAGVSPAGLVVDPARPTTVKTRILAQGQQVVRVDRERHAPAGAAAVQGVLEQSVAGLAGADVVVLSDYAKGVADPAVCAALVRRARRGGVAVVVDPKGRDYAKYAGATALTPNKAEAGQATGRDLSDEAALLVAGGELLRAADCQAVLITRGEEGLSLFRAGVAAVHLPTFSRKVYDVTGAGDTVVATLALGLAAGADLLEAAYLANHAAGVVVGRVGAATLTPAELLAAVAAQPRAGGDPSRQSRANWT